MQNDVQKVEAKPMGASDLRRALIALHGLYSPQPLRERYLLATAEDLPHACEDM